MENGMNVKIGIIGGSGLDNPELFHDAADRQMDTPWGAPSSPLKEGKIAGVDVALLARHGRNHSLPPTQVNYRANIQALRDAGCTHILATTAVGSLREEIRRGDLIIVDQFIDFTRQRKMTFFESFEAGNIKHTPMADPYDPTLRALLYKAARARGFACHEKGTVITIEGPRFSTRAESNMFRIWGADIINMSVATETVLANEIGIPYGAIAMSTDYDCWKQDEEPVSWEAILEVFHANAQKVTQVLLDVIAAMGRGDLL
jgi:5'-methylthioadenosine phosphorylase